MATTHLKKRILVPDRIETGLQTAGIRLYVEDLKPGSNKDMGPKNFFEMGCIEDSVMAIPDESIYAQLLEHGLDAAFLTHPDGTIIYANPAACRLFGYTLDEFRSLGRRAVVDPSDTRLIEALAQRCETGRFQGTLPLRRKDGSRFSAALSSAVYTDSSGELRTSMFVRDLTQQEKREEALRVANAKLSRALEEVHQLQGILPICSYCKRIRNDADYWQQVEAYISAHAPVKFSHCVCPTCYEQHVRPDLEKYNGKVE